MKSIPHATSNKPAAKSKAPIEPKHPPPLLDELDEPSLSGDDSEGSEELDPSVQLAVK